MKKFMVRPCHVTAQDIGSLGALCQFVSVAAQRGWGPAWGKIPRESYL